MTEQMRKWKHEMVLSMMRVLAASVGTGIIAVGSYFFLPFWQALAALPETLERIDERLAKVEVRTAALEGGDRIIRQPLGYSYVEEPVHAGERIVWHLFLGRTELGLPCEYLGGASLFTGERGVPFRGPDLPVIVQVGRDVEELRIPLMPPPELRPSARVSLEGQLRYRCPGENGTTRTVVERTDPTFFLLLPGRRPADED